MVCKPPSLQPRRMIPVIPWTGLFQPVWQLSPKTISKNLKFLGDSEGEDPESEDNDESKGKYFFQFYRIVRNSNTRAYDFCVWQEQCSCIRAISASTTAGYRGSSWSARCAQIP